MNVLFIIVTFIGIGLLGYLIVLDNRKAHRQRLRIKKMYAGPMFQALLPILKSFKKRPFEQLKLDASGVYIRLLQPAGAEIRFLFSEHGSANLTPEKQEALLTLIESALPKLTDVNRYRLRKKHRKQLNGKYEPVYSYIMDIEYKIALNRAPYYDGTFQTMSNEML